MRGGLEVFWSALHVWLPCMPAAAPPSRLNPAPAATQAGPWAHPVMRLPGGSLAVSSRRLPAVRRAPLLHAAALPHRVARAPQEAAGGRLRHQHLRHLLHLQVILCSTGLQLL